MKNNFYIYKNLLNLFQLLSSFKYFESLKINYLQDNIKKIDNNWFLIHACLLNKYTKNLKIFKN